MNKKQEILDAFNFRFACKDFNPNKKISDEDFAFILETGRLSPSSFGFEPWKFIVVQNMELRERLKEYAPGVQHQLPTASHFVLLLSRKADDLMPNSDYINYISRDIQKLPETIIEMRNDFYKNFIEKDSGTNNAKNIFDWAAKTSLYSTSKYDDFSCANWY